MTRYIVITGANRGIGLAFVDAHLSAGDTVFAGCRAPEQATDLQQRAAEYPDQLIILRVDVTDETLIANMAEQVTMTTSHLDRLVNNAAIFHTTPLTEITLARSQQSFAVNSIGPVLMFQAFLPLLQAATRPLVLNVSSNRGSVSGQQDAKLWDYAASKAALNSYTRKMAVTLAANGGCAVAIDPGWVQTRLGGADAALTPKQSVSGMMRVLDGLDDTQNGSFLRWDGRPSPW